MNNNPVIGEPFNPFGRFNISPIPEAISRYRSLSPGAKLIYGRLCRYAGEDGKAYPSVGTLGDECGLSGNQARRYIRELKAVKLIETKACSGGTNHYSFLWHPAFNGDRGEDPEGPG